MDLEERFRKIEEDVAFIGNCLAELASGTKEAFTGTEAELVYIKSHLGLTQAAPTGLKFKGK
jgi:hypothetical protein